MNCIRGDNFHCFVTFKVGDGSCITFWFDPWCGESSLKDIFLEPLGLACINEAYVAELLSFLRGWFPLECQFCLIGSRLGVGVGCLGFDLFWFGEREWKGLDLLETFPHGGFHCRSYYKILYSTIQSSFPWKSLWKSKVSMKVNFFLWTAALGRILTTNNLWKR